MKKILVTALFCTLSAALFGLPAARDKLLADKPLVADAYEATTLQNDSSRESEAEPLEMSSDESLSVTGWEGRYLPMESIFLTYTVDSECQVSDYYYRNEGFEIVAEQFLGESLEIVCKFNDVLPSLKMIFVMSDGSELTTTLMGVEADDYLVFQKDDEASPALNMPETVETSFITLTGQFLWQTLNKNKDLVYADLAFFKVIVYDEDVLFDDKLGEFYFDRYGKYSFTFENQTGWNEDGGCDVYYKVFMAGEHVQVIDEINGDIYYYEEKIEDNITKNLNRGVSFLYESSFHSPILIAQAAIYASMFADEYYYEIPMCTIVYPAPGNKSQCYDTILDNIFIKETHDSYYHAQAQESWDSIMHEYGHFITYHLGSGDDVGGSHDWEKDLIEDYDQETACRLAWSEGWAQMFSYMAQDWAIQNQYNIADFQYVGDTSLTYEDLNFDMEDNYNKGERNERSVLSFLFDLFDKQNEGYYDTFSFDYRTMLNLVLNAKPITFREFYNLLPDRQSGAYDYLLQVCGMNY